MSETTAAPEAPDSDDECWVPDWGHSPAISSSTWEDFSRDLRDAFKAGDQSHFEVLIERFGALHAG